MRTSGRLALIHTLFLAGCGPTAPVAPAVDLAAEEAAIRKLDEQWSAAAGRKDVDAVVAFYTADAAVLAPNAPLALDAKAVREGWAGLLGIAEEISWKPLKIEVARSGEMAYLYGTYSLVMKAEKGAAPVKDNGKILEVWRKQADGAWKCVADAFNTDEPLPAPEPKKK